MRLRLIFKPYLSCIVRPFVDAIVVEIGVDPKVEEEGVRGTHDHTATGLEGSQNIESG